MSAVLQDPAVRAVQILGAAGVLTVVHDAVDQNRLRALYDRINLGRGPRAATLDKEGLCAAVVRRALAEPEALELLAKELARVGQREAGLVHGIPDAEMREQVLALPALQLRRERARILWALAADPRPSAQAVAEEMVGALMRALGQAQTVQARVAATPDVLQETVQEVQHHVRSYERHAEGMQAQVRRLERERADAMAQLGAREARLREETEARATAEREAALLSSRIRELETALTEARAEVARLRDEARVPADASALEAQVEELKERLHRALQQRDERERDVAELHARVDRLRTEQHGLASALVARDQAAQERIRLLRDTLRDVRRQRARPADTDAPPSHVERMAVHVDVANLSAGALRHSGGRVDFIGLLGRLAAGRNVARAVAYAVEPADPERFPAFCGALREAGYEVRIKRPVTRADGSTKADWDMGLAMDVVDDLARVDTVVLCSGDGDFVPLVQLMRRRGKRVEVAAFRADAHEELLRSVHAFHPLGEELILRA